MMCPVCDNSPLREVAKEGILIDICPSCKGVWLDRGELEKIMQDVQAIRPAFNQWYQDKDEDDKQKRASFDSGPSSYKDSYPPASQSSRHGHEYPKHKKKKSVMDVLGDLFE